MGETFSVPPPLYQCRLCRLQQPRPGGKERIRFFVTETQRSAAYRTPRGRADHPKRNQSSTSVHTPMREPMMTASRFRRELIIPRSEFSAGT